jgi:hypothetical protein
MSGLAGTPSDIFRQELPQRDARAAATHLFAGNVGVHA